ncbi:hypothetical protein ABIF07_005466 [Bradyrhizobium elkanii]|nr:hypothetical protein [Bradyrhizobium elkanii]
MHSLISILEMFTANSEVTQQLTIKCARVAMPCMMRKEQET